MEGRKEASSLDLCSAQWCPRTAPISLLSPLPNSAPPPTDRRDREEEGRRVAQSNSLFSSSAAPALPPTWLRRILSFFPPPFVRRAAVSSHLRRDPQATGNQQDGRGRWWPGAGARLECIGELSVTLQQRVRVRHRRPSFFLHGWVSLSLAGAVHRRVV